MPGQAESGGALTPLAATRFDLEAIVGAVPYPGRQKTPQPPCVGSSQRQCCSFPLAIIPWGGGVSG